VIAESFVCSIYFELLDGLIGFANSTAWLDGVAWSAILMGLEWVWRLTDE
jgi:hypothetical protein